MRIGSAEVQLPDTELLDQDGRRVRFYTDLIKGKVVVLSFFFTSCVNVCVTQGVNLKKLQSLLAGRLGEEVFFISVSRDPETDTPARLKQWGVNFGVRRGWTLVAGNPDAVDKLVKDLSGESAGPGDHTPMILIGNDRSGDWWHDSGFADPASLLKNINQVAASRER